jgi:hypothetical protein
MICIASDSNKKWPSCRNKLRKYCFYHCSWRHKSITKIMFNILFCAFLEALAGSIFSIEASFEIVR